MIKMIESTAFSEVTDYEVIDTGIIKVVLYKGTIKDKDNGLSGYGEWFVGDSDFAKGDKFDADSTVTFFSYKYEAPESPSLVFYFANDYETAKKGNSGVFSYRDRSSSYGIYWIIDLDEGYVFEKGKSPNFDMKKHPV